MEQWACSRTHPTFVITTFTGLLHHKVMVGILGVPINEDAWSPRLRVYLEAVSGYHARKKETPLGMLMVTNLSSFPSALTVIAIPGGDITKRKEDFIVNENLKRLGCSGRAVMNLSPPVAATQAKFNQLYRTSDRFPVRSAVIELVRLCQVALVIFDKLPPEYTDGLLCDVTERSINDWWLGIGADCFAMEPSDGILGPTTVAAILGVLLGARNRLSTYGAPVAKDVFNLKATRRGIAYFQKSLKLPKTRRLDRHTVERLHKATSKAANSEGWAVPRAVKSTVAELSGKNNDKTDGMAGGWDKGGIAEVETVDIEIFIRNVSGNCCKSLWYGQPRTDQTGDPFGTLLGEDEMVFSGDEPGGYSWSSRKRNSITDQRDAGLGESNHPYLHPTQSSQNSLNAPEKDQSFHKTVLKSVTGRMSDAKSGLGRFKDAVGIPSIRGHYHRSSKEDNFVLDEGTKPTRAKNSPGRIKVVTPPQFSTHESLSRERGRKPTDVVLPQETIIASSTVLGYDKKEHGLVQDSPMNLTNNELVLSPVDISSPQHIRNKRNETENEEDGVIAKSTAMHFNKSTVMELARANRERDVSGLLDLSERSGPVPFRGTQSLCELPSQARYHEMQDRLPRHLSFSVIDDEPRNDVDETRISLDPYRSDTNVEAAFSNQLYLSIMAQRRAAVLRRLELDSVNLVQQRISGVEKLDERVGEYREELNTVYCRKDEELVALTEATTDLVAEEKNSLTEAIKDIEGVTAKLEYELTNLQSKVEDVEDGVAEFERQVLILESRVQELEDCEVGEEPWLWRVFGLFSWNRG